MPVPGHARFPLVEVTFAANARNEWEALLLGFSQDADVAGTLRALFGTPDLLVAVAPLDCIVLLDDAAALTPSLLELLPMNRVVFAFAAATLADAAALAQVTALHEEGYRVLVDGALPTGVVPATALRALSLDCSSGAPLPQLMHPLCKPCLARGVDSVARQAECAAAGFTWFSGTYPLDPSASHDATHATSRRRLLALLALLARDADSRELEALLKQDAVLAFQLLRLVNSAAFALNTTISGFNQAISLLGRRQLQRWLQLLLYARQQADGLPNLLLPLAALRGGQMEALSKQAGADHNTQDLAFMTGAFSLLDCLFGTPMAQLMAELSLPPQVAAALLRREGALGQMLRLVESVPAAAELDAAGIDPLGWWRSQLHAWHWAIQVGRNAG